MYDVSIVMPCLNERDCLPFCIANARDAIAMLQNELGLSGEIIVADNGSTDGSREIATEMGARVAAVAERGYGAALRGGFKAAQGRFLVMGDADGSYDFRDCVAMIAALQQGADIAMGSRFRGGIAPGAMPWKNRYIGNPVLTGLLNLFFGTRVSDAHCGLRALTRQSFERLRLEGDGMEFASEMIVKAALMGLSIAETPATLSPDLRSRPPHLKPWRDGWRHLRFLLMLSPFWLFALPGLTLLLIGALLFTARLWAPVLFIDPDFFGTYWTVLAGGLTTVGHQLLILAFAAELAGIHAGYRQPNIIYRRLARLMRLEAFVAGGVLLLLAGCVVLGSVFAFWAARSYAGFSHVLPAVGGVTLLVLGSQSIFGGFLLGVIAGNHARLLRDPSGTVPPAANLTRAA